MRFSYSRHKEDSRSKTAARKNMTSRIAALMGCGAPPSIHRPMPFSISPRHRQAAQVVAADACHTRKTFVMSEGSFGCQIGILEAENNRRDGALFLPASALARPVSPGQRWLLHWI